MNGVLQTQQEVRILGDKLRVEHQKSESDRFRADDEADVTRQSTRNNGLLVFYSYILFCLHLSATKTLSSL